MVKRIINWIAGLFQSKLSGPLSEVRLEILGKSDAPQVRRLQKNGPKGGARIEGICTLEVPER